jgi:hypothetical protein
MIVVTLNEDMQSMQRFEYRHPRFSVDLPAQFSIANETLAARCTDISVKGLRLHLLHAIAPGSRGTLTVRCQNQTIALNARVVRTSSEHSGLEFLCDSTAQQSSVAQLVASLTAPHLRHHMSLVPKINAPLCGPSLGGPLLRH